MREKKTVWKWFWVWEFEKEERWLNEMAQSGWILDSVGFCKYIFVRDEPGSYTIRVEMHEQDDAYLEFMRDLGAEYIGRMIQWVYFRMPAAAGGFDLFSDIDSRIQHLDRIGKVLSCIGTANLLIGIANSISASHTGWINLLCATLLMYGLGRIHGKKEAMVQERQLHE